jgi:hypothetical protein
VLLVLLVLVLVLVLLRLLLLLYFVPDGRARAPQRTPTRT